MHLQHGWKGNGWVLKQSEDDIFGLWLFRVLKWCNFLFHITLYQISIIHPLFLLMSNVTESDSEWSSYCIVTLMIKSKTQPFSRWGFFFDAGEAVKLFWNCSSPQLLLCLLCHLHAMKVAEAISFVWFMCINWIWCVLTILYLMSMIMS